VKSGLLLCAGCTNWPARLRAGIRAQFPEADEAEVERRLLEGRRLAYEK